MSQRSLKRRHLSLHYVDFDQVCQPALLQAMHLAWWSYIRDLMQMTQNDQQLQLRLSEAELVGAVVTVHAVSVCSDRQQTQMQSLVGVRGIVIAQSKHVLYIFHGQHEPLLGQSSSAGSEQLRRQHRPEMARAAKKWVKIDKREVVLAVMIPCKQRSQPAQPLPAAVKAAKPAPEVEADRVASAGAEEESRLGKSSAGGSDGAAASAVSDSGGGIDSEAGVAEVVEPIESDWRVLLVSGQKHLAR
jgi:hypothetical protein